MKKEGTDLKLSAKDMGWKKVSSEKWARSDGFYIVRCVGGRRGRMSTYWHMVAPDKHIFGTILGATRAMNTLDEGKPFRAIFQEIKP